MPSKSAVVTVDEIRKHASADSLWLVVDNKVWDMTEFAPEHPGGTSILLRYAGKDATKPYNEIHAPSLISETLSPSKLKGTLDQSSVDPEWTKPPPEETKQLQLGKKPPLHTLLNAFDFERVGSETINPKAWAYFSSAATDLITLDANRNAYNRIWFRPRVFRNVRKCDTRTKILGCESSLPLMISPAAMAKVVHPDGEKVLARAAASQGIIQAISTNASYSVTDIVPSAPAGHPFVFQLYVNKDRAKTESLLRIVESLGVKAIFVTVDAHVIGKREADERIKADDSLSPPMSGTKNTDDKKGGGLARTTGAFIDESFEWEDLAWLRRVTKLPLVVKGIQGAADAKMAMRWGVDGIVVSNHGGRSLDTTPASVLVLLELQKNCPEVFDKMEVFVDGGIRRGTDILKALCLGARAVGMGRTFLYALNYGQEGVEHFVDIMRDELETSMRLLGITDLSQCHPGLLNTGDVDHLIPSLEEEHPYAKWRPKAVL
ncbi:hypothetical protein K402DRAFT_329641 [Aulographum hederae CBS 113979]|uniref:L-lactate dehydrogenase (cytochrome) n=1 Tax=Aulographum hederae CBS 113979 TaxID=1176131 RepID=A0A6G1H4H8_9PEZI|nr:hypothetical protein K402DRAFT_329641 [Aulographum hederae CBS 113979]